MPKITEAEKIAGIIREVRRREGLTQQALANAAGVQ